MVVDRELCAALREVTSDLVSRLRPDDKRVSLKKDGSITADGSSGEIAEKADVIYELAVLSGELGIERGDLSCEVRQTVTLPIDHEDDIPDFAVELVMGWAQRNRGRELRLVQVEEDIIRAGLRDDSVTHWHYCTLFMFNGDELVGEERFTQATDLVDPEELGDYVSESPVSELSAEEKVLFEAWESEMSGVAADMNTAFAGQRAQIDQQLYDAAKRYYRELTTEILAELGTMLPPLPD